MNAMFKSIFFLFACITIFTETHAQADDAASIRRVLAQQQQDWNRGRIDAFMTGYWNSDSLLFVGKNGPVYGYRQTLQNYKKRYADTVAMSQLVFENLTVKKLAGNYCFVIGEWKLTRKAGNLGGYFTLLFKKFGNRWRIVVDHTS